MILACVIRDYFGPPIGLPIGLSLAAISFLAALVGLAMKARGTEPRKKLGMRFIIGGNVGTVLAILSWFLLRDVSLW